MYEFNPNVTIYTSYFANEKKLPSHIVPVSISLSTPKGWTGLSYKDLAPTWDILQQYKKGGSWNTYTERFHREILSDKDPHKVVHDLRELTQSDVFSMDCWESSGFCHRHLVAEWLMAAGYPVYEFSPAKFMEVL